MTIEKVDYQSLNSVEKSSFLAKSALDTIVIKLDYIVSFFRSRFWLIARHYLEKVEFSHFLTIFEVQKLTKTDSKGTKQNFINWPTVYPNLGENS